MNNIIELESENGLEKFELLLRFRFKGTDYIALRPEREEEDTAAIFEIRKTDGGAEQYMSISDSKKAKEVFVHFVTLWEMAQNEEDDNDESV